MPYKFDGTPINNPDNDRRVKLTDEDRDNIREDYATGNYSQRELARKYQVSRRTIQFELNPDDKKRSAQLFAERQKTGRYYDKEKHNAYMKKHRDYKKELYKSGKLTVEDADKGDAKND